MPTWKNSMQKEIIKSLIDQLDRLEAENEQLKKSNTGNTSNVADNNTYINDEEKVRSIKLKVFGPDLDEDER